MIKMLSLQTAINFRWFHRIFFKTLKGQIITNLIKLLQNKKLPNSIYKVSLAHLYQCKTSKQKWFQQKWQNGPLKIFSSIKSRKWSKIVKLKFFSELCKSTKCLQQSWECLFKKNLNFSNTSKQCDSLPYPILIGLSPDWRQPSKLAAQQQLGKVEWDWSCFNLLVHR